MTVALLEALSTTCMRQMTTESILVFAQFCQLCASLALSCRVSLSFQTAITQKYFLNAMQAEWRSSAGGYCGSGDRHVGVQRGAVGAGRHHV